MTMAEQGSGSAPCAPLSDVRPTSYEDLVRRLEERHWPHTRFRVMDRPVRLGVLLQRTGRLSRLDYDLRSALVNDAGHDAFETLLGEAFGTAPDPQQAGRLRWKYRNQKSRRKTSAPEVFGAYALSAGLRLPLLNGGGKTADIVCKALDAILAEAKASGPAAYQRGIEALADLVALARADLLRVIQQRLLPVAYEFSDHVPPLASSPCGVIRLASPEVPRGSLRVLQSDALGPLGASPFLALAA
ncbi:hypothetical protein [Streptomyces sp. NPDC056401]|uniref:hypothetical protein n=1 Tax=Streptomyces sp. NPDC056401 TaxID=3345809 RepID=UPI0035D83FF2